jgi:hypothetical protein
VAQCLFHRDSAGYALAAARDCVERRKSPSPLARKEVHGPRLSNSRLRVPGWIGAQLGSALGVQTEVSTKTDSAGLDIPHPSHAPAVFRSDEFMNGASNFDEGWV